MRRVGIAIVGLLLLSSGNALADGKIKRTELSRTKVPGSATHEVIVARLEIQPGGTVPRHTHHGDEHLIIIKGGPMKTGSGKVIEFAEGMAVYFPEGKIHGGLTAAGDQSVIAYTTHIVEKGKPLNVPAD